MNQPKTLYLSLSLFSQTDFISFDRYARAERDLKQARPFGEGAKKFYDAADIKPSTDNPKELLVAMTSDRGNYYIQMFLLARNSVNNSAYVTFKKHYLNYSEYDYYRQWVQTELQSWCHSFIYRFYLSNSSVAKCKTTNSRADNVCNVHFLMAHRFLTINNKHAKWPNLSVYASTLHMSHSKAN